ncbi:MAG: hypothetical protein H0W75_12390 [Chitinophagaceae bacterium]|nr:hypothetical protein [Chitinophagaceae bacterium]HEV8079589.1 hypothetical protein [Chitinophagaceae bacterium]
MKTSIAAIDKEINQYLVNLDVQQKKTVLTVVKTFAREKKDWWDVISKEQQQATDESIQQMNSGKVIAHADVMKKYKKWIKK